MAPTGEAAPARRSLRRSREASQGATGFLLPRVTTASLLLLPPPCRQPPPPGRPRQDRLCWGPPHRPALAAQVPKQVHTEHSTCPQTWRLRGTR